jgi:hypothetical protein
MSEDNLLEDLRVTQMVPGPTSISTNVREAYLIEMGSSDIGKLLLLDLFCYDVFPTIRLFPFRLNTLVEPQFSIDYKRISSKLGQIVGATNQDVVLMMGYSHTVDCNFSHFFTRLASDVERECWVCGPD